MKKVLSGIQPTGVIHIGNYFGAIQNFVNLQSNYDCKFGVMDYHAMTTKFKPNLKQDTTNTVLSLLALGINVESLFIQSLVPEHVELATILGSFTPYGLLSRMTQFKDKSDLLLQEDKNNAITSALFNYPVLQAADILIYKSDYVPVGKDQEQHLQLTKSIATKFNYDLGLEYFNIPEIMFTETPKIKSLVDPTKKMSKSLGLNHCISIFEEEKVLLKKIRKAVTDSGQESGMSDGVSNLFSIIKACDIKTYNELIPIYNDSKLLYGDLKQVCFDVLNPIIMEFRERRLEIESNNHLSNVIESSLEIRKVAIETLKEVKELCGLFV